MADEVPIKRCSNVLLAFVLSSLTFAPRVRARDRSDDYFNKLSVTDFAGILALAGTAQSAVREHDRTQQMITQSFMVLAGAILTTGPAIVHLSEGERTQAGRSFLLRGCLPISALLFRDELGTPAAAAIGASSFVGGVYSDYRFVGEHSKRVMAMFSLGLHF